MPTRTCVVCGKDFAASHGAQRLCSEECRHQRSRYHAKRFHEKYPEGPPLSAKKRCAICGATFRAGKAASRPLTATTCSRACEREQHRKLTLAAQARHHATVTRVCIACGATFRAVDRPLKPTCSDNCALRIRRDAHWRRQQRQRAKGVRAQVDERRIASGKSKVAKRRWKQRKAEEQAQWEILALTAALGL